ncbi:hypothetical protein ACWEQ8_37640, partial [Streptomyces noursei]
ATVGWKGRKAAWLGVIAFVCYLFNYFIVNIYGPGEVLAQGADRPEEFLVRRVDGGCALPAGVVGDGVVVADGEGALDAADVDALAGCVM